MTKLRNTLHSLITIICALAIVSSLIATTTRAQQATASPPAIQPINRVELHQALVDLTNTWTVMCVAAHPDDEDGTTLTVLRRRDGAHTVSLFSTYGEGGQNAVGPELYEELGVIRAQETMKAAKIQGSEPYFLGLKDFGFSKSAEEAFTVWGHDEALRRMVLKIRELRPDVIITNHDTTSGHGHHQATGRLIIEAFDAAADPKRFPDQLDRAKPWQAQRLFVRLFGANTQKPAGEADKVFAIDPNEIDPVRGTSFAEQALAALQQHATQGPWPKSIAELMRARRIEAGKLPLIRYRLVRQAAGVPGLPQNAITPLAGLELPPTLVSEITPPSIEGRPLSNFLDRPDRLLAVLIGWRASRGLRTLTTGDVERFRLFESRVDQALAIATGISLTLTPRASVLVPGIQSSFSVGLANPSTRAVRVDDLRLNGWEAMQPDIADVLLPDTETTVTIDSTTPKSAPLTVPQEEHLYDGLFLGKNFAASALVDVDGAKFLVHSETALAVVPAVEIKSISPSPCVRTEETLGRCDAFKVTLLNHLTSPFRGTMEVGATSAGHTRSTVYQLVLGPNEQREDNLSLHDARPARETLRERRSSGSVEFTIKVVDSTELVTKRTASVVYSAARVRQNLRVGYVASFDQTLEHSLAALGVAAQALTVDEVKTADLSIYNTIIIDNRGYEAHPQLIAENSRLLNFVQTGGTLIVFYHKDNEWNPDEKKGRPQLAPYPIILDDKRVTDETAPITFLKPRHRLVNFPNRINQADFANWIQERGLYYPREWDEHYTELFSTHDPGEPPLIGGLLVAPHGKGNYMYTSMVWYRQLRAGVPGAYRMFANMISYGHR